MTAPSWPATSSPVAGPTTDEPLFVPTLLDEMDELLDVIRRPIVLPAPIRDKALEVQP